MTKTKIVIPIWAFTRAGGMRVLTQLANNWFAAGIDVLIISLAHSDIPYYPVMCPIQYIDNDGGAIERKNTIQNESLIRKIGNQCGNFFAMKKALNRLCDDEKYNTVIANFWLTAYPASCSKIRNKFYYIQAYEPGFGDSDSIKRRMYRWCAKYTYHLPLIRVVNADIYKSYKEVQSKYVVHPGLDLNTYYPKQEKWNKKNALTVGCIGRAELWKGAQDVADAVTMLHDRGIKITFKVAFNPVICDDYELVRPDGDANLADYYRSVDILVAPGRIQLGAVHYPVIEAMACGTPVITTGFYPADNTNSYIVPVADPQAISDIIEHITLHYDEAIEKSKHALQKIQSFSWPVVSADFLKIIEENFISD